MSTSDATKITFKLNRGRSVPGLGLGTASFGDVVAAIKARYGHIDSAWAYPTGRELGEGIKEAIAQGLVEREDLFVTTKVSHSLAHGPERSLNESPEKLQLDYVDSALMSLEPAWKEDGSIDREAVNPNTLVYDYSEN